MGRRVTGAEAEQEMLRAGYEPLGPYPGSVSRPWAARCAKCLALWQVHLKNVRSGQRCTHNQKSPGDLLTPVHVERLAALSRDYRRAREEITVAIAQEMGRSLDPEWRAAVGVRFGLSEEEFARHQPEEIKRLHHGFIHRAGLRSAEEVTGEVMRKIRVGALKPGDQLPPRTVFTEQYHCDKRTYGEVLAWLRGREIVARRGERAGPMLVQAPPDGQSWDEVVA